jgi:hypothetical protein
VRVRITGSLPVTIGGTACSVPIGFAFHERYRTALPLFWVDLPPGANPTRCIVVLEHLIHQDRDDGFSSAAPIV